MAVENVPDRTGKKNMWEEREGKRGGRRHVEEEGRNSLYASAITVRVILLERIWGGGTYHTLTQMCIILVAQPEGKRSLGRPTCG
jgi:hypothetical protein